MKLEKNISLGKNNFILILLILSLFLSIAKSEVNTKSQNEGKFVEIKILDKVSSKNSKLEIQLGKETKFKNLLIKVLKCKNSEFDDNPEVTAYLQVKDTSNKSNDEVFVFNGWTFSSSPSIRPFDHPVYDIWLTKCY
jgi:hypothetical protein|tara:strand:- start:62 stop:472 length:411 start_codon:yes stop_codon:yes gene_type:complete